MKERNTRTAYIVLITAGFAVAAVVLLPPLLLFLLLLVAVRPLREVDVFETVEPAGPGLVEVEPSRVLAGGGPVPVRIRYTVGRGGIARGGSLRLYPSSEVLRFGPDAWRLCLQWSNGWGNLQRRKPGEVNYLEASTSRAGAQLEVDLMEHAVDRTQIRWLKRKLLQKLGFRFRVFNPEDAFLANQRVTVTIQGADLREGDTIDFVLGAGAGIEVPYSSMKTDYGIEVDTAGSGDFELESSLPALTATGGRASRFEVVAPTVTGPGSKINVLVRCLDDRGELTPDYAGALRVHSTGPLEAPSEVVFDGEEGVAWFEAVVSGTGVGGMRVASETAGLEGTSNPVVSREKPGLLLWGDLHMHSLVSDGTREPWYMYHRGRDLKGWDFTAVPEHDSWSLGEEQSRTPEELALMARVADEYYEPGRFVTFHCYEWTHHRHGHRNVYFGPGEPLVLFSHVDPATDTPAKLLEALKGMDVLVVPHHPAWRDHYGEMYFDFGPPGNDLERLVEVYSRHGNSEYYGCPRPISHVGRMEGLKGKVVRQFLGNEFAGPRSGSYVRDALARGYRFGLIAGSDEHLVGVDPRKGPGQLYGGGITGVFAGARTREAVWGSLKDRHVCGTTGARMLLELWVNGFPQGSEIAADRPPVVKALVLGTDDVETAQVVKHDSGGYDVVWEEEPGGPRSEIEFTDGTFTESAFYYLRVVQSDGHMGWAGPVWVDRS